MEEKRHGQQNSLAGTEIKYIKYIKYIILHILVDCSGAGALPGHGGKWWWLFVVPYQRGFISSCQCMLLLAFKMCFFALLVTAINCISEWGTWLLHFCLTVPEPSAMAMSCPGSCRSVGMCSSVLHPQEGWCWGDTRSFYGLNFEWQKGSNTDLVKAEVFL